MVSPFQEARKSESSPVPTDEWTLEEMRERVAVIADDLKKVVAARAEAAKDQTQEGVAVVRKNIRKQPAVAMGVAVATGAALAVLLVPRFGRRRPASRWEAWIPSMPSLTRADLYDFANNVQHSAMRAANSVPMTASLE